jgi:tetratricopeptide (TPR) repeat protein
MSQPVPSASSLRTQPEIFFGRENELREFSQSIRCVLGLEQPAAKHLLYPHIFLLNGEGGTGKSALLRQFQAVAAEEGLAANRAVVIALRTQYYPDARVLAQTLVDAIGQAIGQQFPKFGELCRGKLTLRNTLLPFYSSLQHEWALWQSMGELSANDRSTLLQKHYRLSGGRVTRATLLGGAHQSTYLNNRVDLIASRLRIVLDFLRHFGRAPNSFEELLHFRFPDVAGLFQSDAMIGEALADDIANLTKTGPLLLLLDDYEYADQHDEWLRTSLLAQANERLIVVIAGRYRHEADYRRTFQGPQAQLVRSYNLNARLTTEDMKAYLSKRLGNADALAEVSSICDGVPLALTALGDHLTTDDSLALYQKKPPTDRTPHSIVKHITQRLLHNAFGERNGDLSQGQRKLRDSQRIRALVLLRRPDPTLACELWGIKPDEGDAIMHDLARRYTFAFAGQRLYEVHSLVREVLHEDLLARTRYTTEWKADINGLRRARETTENRIAQIERSLQDPTKHYQHAEWRAATLDLLNFLLWLGEDDEARRLLLNRWVEARNANAAFADWLLDQAVELAPSVASWRELIQSLQTENYEVILPLAHLLDPRIKAILWYERAQLVQVALVNTSTLPQLDKQIEMLEESNKFDQDWKPTIDALREAYAARGAFRLYEQNAPAEALADFGAILKLRPHDLAALRCRAVAKQRLDDPQGARADFDEVLNKMPLDSAARLSRAILLAQQGQRQEAEDDFKQVHEQHKDDPVVLQLRGENRYQAGNFMGAFSDFSQSLQLRNDDPDTLVSRARVLVALGGPADLKSALNDLDRVLRRRPDDADALSMRGELKFKQKDFAGALPDLNRSLELRPDHAATLYLRARAYLNLPDEDRALDDLNKSLMLHGDNAAALADRGSIKNKRGDFAGALDDFNQSLKLRPDDMNILYKHAITKLELNELADAEADLDRVIKHQPDHFEAYYYRGRIKYRRRDWDGALADFTKALGIQPDYVPAIYYHGRTKRARKELHDALADFKSVLKHQLNHIPALYYGGRTKYDLKKYKEAKEDFDKIIQIEPTHRNALYWHGRAVIATRPRQYAAALDDFDRALKSGPATDDDPDAPDDYEIIYQRAKASRVDMNALLDLWSTAPRHFARRLGYQL